MKKAAVRPRALAVASAAAVLVVSLLIVAGRTGSPQDASAVSSVLFSGTSKGSPDAPITIVEYSDFQCYFCQKFALTTMRQLDEAYVAAGKVRFVYKHFIGYGDESLLAAIASELAAEQNKFWPFHDLLMQMRASPKKEDLTAARLRSLAQEVGLNMEAFDSGLHSGKYREKVMRDDAEARTLGISATPTFVINGKYGLRGGAPFETFREIISDLLEKEAK
ncbi:MAG: thioredoxin domain-containing protein [Dehalococcoidia bacterium]|nr:thioredoxin domain-containing protein [Dehalococcoidia bacterium]